MFSEQSTAAKVGPPESAAPEERTILVTSRAAKVMRDQLRKRGTPLAAIRLGIRGGGCTGYSYLFEFADDEFRKSRAEYQDLAQKFSTALDPRLKQQRKRLLDQFNGLKRRIDSRYRTLPDKNWLESQS